MEQISVQHFQHQFNRVLIKRMPREEKKKILLSLEWSVISQNLMGEEDNYSNKRYRHFVYEVKQSMNESKRKYQSQGCHQAQGKFPY